MKTKDIERARLEHRSVYCIDKDTSDVLRCSVGLFGSFDSQFDVELTPEYNESTKECIHRRWFCIAPENVYATAEEGSYDIEMLYNQMRYCRATIFESYKGSRVSS